MQPNQEHDNNDNQPLKSHFEDDIAKNLRSDKFEQIPVSFFGYKFIHCYVYTLEECSDVIDFLIRFALLTVVLPLVGKV